MSDLAPAPAGHVVGTAGHVDHGKSTLVRTLTGMDPDRFAEEKARGLTIDLGFAWTTLPSGRRLALVDVPGHVRFIRNMLAGAGAIDACLFVVAATEGWKPQSEEHLRILDLLGIARGLVVLTKVAAVDDDTRELAHLEIEEAAAHTFLAGAEVVETDAVAGVGIDALVEALDRLLAATPTALDLGRPRLWIDRVFAARGSGTVVTGTLTGGWLSVDDEVECQPTGLRARIRALQSTRQSHSSVPPGSRVAVNLAGVERSDLARGHVIVRPGTWHVTRAFDGTLAALASLDHTVASRGAYMAYVGSGEHPVKARVLGSGEILPGEEGLVRVHLPTALPLLPGDRFVLRESGRDETVGGGEVLDVAPVRPAAKARPDRSVERVVAERGWVEADLLHRLTGHRLPPTVGRWVVDPATQAAATEELVAAVAEAGPLGLDPATLDDRRRSLVEAVEGIEIRDGRVRPAGAEDPLAGHPYLAELESCLFSPPEPTDVPRGELAELVRRGLVVTIDGVHFAPSALTEAARLVARALEVEPAGVTVAQVRDALGTTRKHALPLLALLDREGFTRRRGDVRVAGPRLDQG